LSIWSLPVAVLLVVETHHLVVDVVAVVQVEFLLVHYL
jgi:hypothetical protein